MASLVIGLPRSMEKLWVDRMIQEFRKCDVVHMDEPVLKGLEVSRDQDRTKPCYK